MTHQCDDEMSNAPLTALRVHQWMHAFLTPGPPNHTELQEIMLDLNGCVRCTTRAFSVAAGIAVEALTQVHGPDVLMVNELTIERLEAELDDGNP